MKNHGGVHKWNLTKAQARGVVRVGTRLMRESVQPLIGCTVVQYSINYLRPSHRLHQGLNPAHVSQDILAPEEKSRRSSHPAFYSNPDTLLYRDYHCQDL